MTVKSHNSELIIKKALEEERHDKQQALKTLQQYFTQRRDAATFPWHSIEENLVREHARLCVELRETSSVFDALGATFNRLRQQANTFRLTALVDIYIAEALKKLNSVRNAEARPAAPVAGKNAVIKAELENAFTAMTGHDLAETSKAHLEELWYRTYVDVVCACLRVTPRANNQGAFSLLKIAEALREVAPGRRVQNVMQLCRQIRAFTEPIRDREKKFKPRTFPGEDERPKIWRDRGDEFLAASAMTQVIATLRTQLSVAAEVGAWTEVLNAVNAARQMLAIFKDHREHVDLAELVTFNVELKRVLVSSKRFNFVAHVAIQIARQVWSMQAMNDDASEAADEAVLAVLAVAESRSTSLAVAHDHEREKATNLAAALDLASPPTRGQLVAELQKLNRDAKSILDLASENVRDLFNVLTADSSVALCQRAAPLLAQVDAKFASYVPAIHECAVRSLLPVVAKCYSTIQIARFINMAAFFTATQFRGALEPIIVDVASDPNGNVSLQIDEADSCIRFRPVASLGDRAVGVQTEFSHRLSVVAAPCYKAVGVTPDPKAVPFDFAEFQRRMTDEAHHVFLRHRLCKAREDKRYEREEAAKADILRRKDEEMQRLVAKAKENTEKLKERHLKKLSDEISRETIIERRKWVVKQLRDRHKGIVFPDTIATDADFLETVVRILKEFNGRIEGAKDNDSKRMDAWERACREVEIPIREQHERDVAAKNEELTQARKENHLKLHREAWERDIATKRALSKFESHRHKYESELSTLLEKKTGKTKREKEEDDLKLAMMERERIAAEMAAKEKAAAPAPAAAAAPPAAAQPAPAAAPSSGAKWVPKSRQQ